MVSTRRYSAKNWDVLARELPITSRFAKLTAHRHQLAKLNSLLLVRVWEELGGIVGFNGTLLVGKFSVRLAAGTDFVPISAEAAVRLKTAQSAVYDCLVSAVNAGAATSIAEPSFNVFVESDIANEVGMEAIRALIPTLPRTQTFGILTEAECRARFPYAAGFLAHRVQERRIEAKLKSLRPAVLTELQSLGLTFDQNISTQVGGYLEVTVALFQQPRIALIPGPTFSEWSVRLATEKAKTAPFLAALRHSKEMVEQLLPNVTVSAGHPKKYLALPVAA